jgi:hypothetical protein
MPRAYGGILQPKAGDKVLWGWPKGKGTQATINSITGGKAEIRFDGQRGVVNCATVFFGSIKFIERPKAAVLAEKLLKGVKAVKP